MTYGLPEQDLRIDLSGMPAIPESRFVIDDVRRTRRWSRRTLAAVRTALLPVLLVGERPREGVGREE